MARVLVKASSQYLTTASAPVTATPITIACWVKQTTGESANGQILRVEKSDNYDQAWGLRTTANTFVTYDFSGGANYAYSGIVADVWQHWAGVSASNSDHLIYLNGVAVNGGTFTAAPVGVDRVTLGRIEHLAADYFNGSLAEAAIWNAALTATEIADLAAGALPVNVRPASLVFYAPLLGGNTPEPDLSGGNRPLTPVNGPLGTADHPPMRYPYESAHIAPGISRPGALIRPHANPFPAKAPVAPAESWGPVPA